MEYTRLRSNTLSHDQFWKVFKLLLTNWFVFKFQYFVLIPACDLLLLFSRLKNPSVVAVLNLIYFVDCQVLIGPLTSYLGLFVFE